MVKGLEGIKVIEVGGAFAMPLAFLAAQQAGFRRGAGGRGAEVRYPQWIRVEQLLDIGARQPAGLVLNVDERGSIGE